MRLGGQESSREGGPGEGGRVFVEMRQLVGQLVVWAGTHTGSTADEDRAPWLNQCGDKLEMSRFNCWCGPSWRCIGLGGGWGGWCLFGDGDPLCTHCTCTCSQ